MIHLLNLWFWCRVCQRNRFLCRRNLQHLPRKTDFRTDGIRNSVFRRYEIWFLRNSAWRISAGIVNSVKFYAFRNLIPAYLRKKFRKKRFLSTLIGARKKTVSVFLSTFYLIKREMCLGKASIENDYFSDISTIYL